MNSEIIKKFCDLLGEERVFTGEAMSRHTTFKIGGPADYFLMPDKDTDVGRIVKICKESAIPYFILGNGSNLLVGDGGYRGAVIQIYKNMSAVTVEGTKITVQAGALLSSVAAAAKNAALTGFEFAGGIPGTMGGAVVMNAGAYGGEMKDVLIEVTVMDEEGEIVTLPADKLELGYRTSIIKTAGYIVLEAKLQLKEGNPEVIRETMKDLTIRRTTKQPLEYPSAGSTFKRPEGYFAGKLIMDSGLAGYQVGGAQVSEKHCGFVINAGGATARDVRTLMDNVRDIVYKKYGVTLEPEVKFLGDFEA
ncbi:UDP-N-acetylmuramate dehydrogenase [Blautia massiliensis (ex Durand et al. 2017)]|uniref:UDP-N-acetylmuramate dehydrogenase n=1 Tax=Blautia massiliensis (ex Durand et al. 2017) TaxID=1737424 RepID=UPI0022E0A8A9